MGSTGVPTAHSIRTCPPQHTTQPEAAAGGAACKTTAWNFGARFSELAMPTHALRSASVMTLEDPELRSIDEQTFFGLWQGEPHCSLHLVEYLARRVAGLAMEISDLALLDVCGRVHNLAGSGEDGLPQIAQFNQQDIAGRAGSSREMAILIFKDRKKGTYILVKSAQITLPQDLPVRR